MALSNIEWTEVTWNPTTGCDKISSGCKFCYAEVMAKRLQGMGHKKYQNGFDFTQHEITLNDPYKWKKKRRIFVNSMSDLFYEKIQFPFLNKVFEVMNDNPIHDFQILTKRTDVLLEYNKRLEWGNNIWMGATVENFQTINRIDILRKSDAKVKFLSFEPLLTALPNLNLEKIDWVIVGGESGRSPRPMKEEWVLDIQEQCRKQNVKFFFKQWGGKNKKESGRELNGKFFNEMPDKINKHELIFDN